MQPLLLLTPVLALGLFLIYLFVTRIYKKSNAQTSAIFPINSDSKKLNLKEYEAFLLGEFGDNAASSLDAVKIGELLIGSLENVCEYDCVSYLLLTNENTLTFKYSIRNPVGHAFLNGVKKRMAASMAAILNKNLTEFNLEEVTVGKFLNNRDLSRVASYFIIPLALGDKPIGILTIASAKKGLYSVDDTELFYATTNRVLNTTWRIQEIIAAEKLSREKKEKEAERRAYQAEVLRELGERVGYSLDLTKSIEIITGSIGRLLPYHTISYMVRSKDRIIFKCDIQEPINRNFVGDVKNKMLEAFSAMLNMPLKKEDVDESITGSIFDESVKDPVNSFFNLPLIIDSKVVGLINVASPKVGIYTEEETSILYTITAQASIAVTKLTEVLEREKGKLNALVASLEDGIVMVDPHWNLLVANTMVRKMLDLPSVEITMLDVLDKLSGKIDIRTKIEGAVAKNKAIASSEITIGKQILQVVTLEVRGRDSENLGAVVVFHDITHEREEKNIIEKKVEERTRQLKEEQSRFIAAINSIPRGFIIVDSQGQVIVTNHILAKILGDGQRGWSLELIHQKLAPSAYDLKASFNKCLESKKPSEEINLTLGSKFLKVYLAPITLEGSENIIGVVILIDDITEAKVLERSRDEFFSIASHELRTPLTAIKGNSSMILEYYSKQLNDNELKAMIGDIHDSSVQLIGIVNDFLNMSRLEQGRLAFKIAEFDISALISSILKELEPVYTRKGLYAKFENAPALKVLADSDKVREVLVNLIGNAVKFTEKGGVTINIGTWGQKGFVRVCDTGKGIPIQSQSLLFRKFQQATNNILTRDSSKGTGLGLYISRMMIAGMGGELTLEKSDDGRGATFKFTLPLAATKTRTAKKPAEVPAITNSK